MHLAKRPAVSTGALGTPCLYRRVSLLFQTAPRDAVLIKGGPARPLRVFSFSGTWVSPTGRRLSAGQKRNVRKRGLDAAEVDIESLVSKHKRQFGK